MWRCLHHQCGGDGLFLALDVLRDGNAGRLEDVYDVDAHARPDLGGIGHELSSHVAGDDGRDDDALRIADVPEHPALARRSQGRKQARVPGVGGFWLLHRLAGGRAGIYAFGIAFATAAMRWESFSRAVPVLSGASLIAAGLFQFTRWKMSGLLRCRSALGCAASCPERERSFLLGCKQGATCCICCTTPMMILLALGVMNPLVMVAVAIVIAAEKLLPRPEIVARLVGASAIIAGVASFCAVFLRPG